VIPREQAKHPNQHRRGDATPQHDLCVLSLIGPTNYETLAQEVGTDGPFLVNLCDRFPLHVKNPPHLSQKKKKKKKTNPSHLSLALLCPQSPLNRWQLMQHFDETACPAAAPPEMASTRAAF
jgi:hypothetical protein